MKLNNSQLNEKQIKTGIKKQIKAFPEFNENEHTVYSKLWDRMKVML